MPPLKPLKVVTASCQETLSHKFYLPCLYFLVAPTVFPATEATHLRPGGKSAPLSLQLISDWNACESGVLSKLSTLSDGRHLLGVIEEEEDVLEANLEVISQPSYCHLPKAI